MELIDTVYNIQKARDDMVDILKSIYEVDRNMNDGMTKSDVQ